MRLQEIFLIAVIIISGFLWTYIGIAIFNWELYKLLLNGFKLSSRIAKYGFSRLIPRQYRESVLGDLAEDYKTTCNSLGQRAARRQFYRQLLKSIPHFMCLSLTDVLKRARNKVRPL